MFRFPPEERKTSLRRGSLPSKTEDLAGMNKVYVHLCKLNFAECEKKLI